jgi:hypothetical protein
MKTTVDLPDGLVRELKLKALKHGRKINVTAMEILRNGADASAKRTAHRQPSPPKDWLTVLKECPVSLDDVPARRKEFPKRRTIQ